MVGKMVKKCQGLVGSQYTSITHESTPCQEQCGPPMHPPKCHLCAHICVPVHTHGWVGKVGMSGECWMLTYKSKEDWNAQWHGRLERAVGRWSRGSSILSPSKGTAPHEHSRSLQGKTSPAPCNPWSSLTFSFLDRQVQVWGDLAPFP